MVAVQDIQKVAREIGNRDLEKSALELETAIIMKYDTPDNQ